MKKTGGTGAQKPSAALVRAAKAAMKNSYSPYSHFKVGAAIEAADGKIYSGTNVETAHYKTVCAEASAISAMIMAAQRRIRVVAVIGPGEGGLCTPCGDCRQRLREFCDDKTRIYSLWPDGTVGAVHGIHDLLPMSFGTENLKKRISGK